MNMHFLHKLKSLASHSGMIMASRLAGAGIGFLTQFLLVRLMGADHLGVFYAGSSLAAVLGVLAAQGYPQIAARFVGRYRNKQDDALCGTFAAHAMRQGLLAASIMALGATLWAQFWPGFTMDQRVTYMIAGFMPLAIVTLNILTNIAGGMRLFALSYMPEGLFRPVVFFVLVAAAGLTGFTLSASITMLIFALVTSSIAIVVAILVVRRLPAVRWMREARPSLTWRWRREAWQLVLLAIFTNFFADVGILVAVPFLTSSDIAVFGLCLKLALLVGYFVQIGQQMAVPDMADARHTRDDERLRRAALRSIILPSAITATSMAVIFMFGDTLLAFFGPEFASGRTALLILLAAQLLRALAGPSAHLLTLSGIQSINLGVATSSLLILFLASAVLSPAFGSAGAASAVLLTYTYWIAISAFALQRLGEPPVDIVWLLIKGWRRPSVWSRPAE